MKTSGGGASVQRWSLVSDVVSSIFLQPSDFDHSPLDAADSFGLMFTGSLSNDVAFPTAVVCDVTHVRRSSFPSQTGHVFSLYDILTL